MIKKKILQIDMDGVICDLEKKMLQLCPELGHIGAGPDWEERSILFNKTALANPNLFRDLEPIEGAKEAIDILSEYFDIYFLSTPMWLVKESYTDKALWLAEHFAHHAEDKLTLTKYKNLSKGDYLIDDTLRNGVPEFEGEHIHFGEGEFNDWEGVVNYLFQKEKIGFPQKVKDFILKKYQFYKF